MRYQQGHQEDIDKPDQNCQDQGLFLRLPGNAPQTKRNGQVYVCQHGEHGYEVQHRKESVATATKDCQSLTLEPTSLPFVADRVQWHVYGSTEQIHDSKIGDENVWNCS